MTAKFRQPVTMTLTMVDVAAALTEAVCSNSFGALAELQVATVHEKGGEFQLQLLPKPRPPVPAKGTGK